MENYNIQRLKKKDEFLFMCILCISPENYVKQFSYLFLTPPKRYSFHKNSESVTKVSHNLAMATNLTETYIHALNSEKMWLVC